MTQSEPPRPPRRKRGWRYVRNLAVAGLLFAVLFYYVLGLFIVSGQWAHPTRLATCCATPADMGLPYEDVSFSTQDGVALEGWYIPSQNGAAVILSHGLNANRSQLLRHAFALAQADFGVLLFDLRAHGNSAGDTLTFNGDDVLAALNYLQGRDDLDSQRIGAFGFSLGGIVTIEAAARTDAIRAVVADGTGPMGVADIPTPQTLGEYFYVPFDRLFYPLLALRTGVPNPPPITESIGAVAPRPVLLIAAGGLEARMAQLFYDSASDPRTLWLIPDVGHGGGISAHPQEYGTRLVTFFSEALLD